jgi:hypothetical protein
MILHNWQFFDAIDYTVPAGNFAEPLRREHRAAVFFVADDPFGPGVPDCWPIDLALAAAAIFPRHFFSIESADVERLRVYFGDFHSATRVAKLAQAIARGAAEMRASRGAVWPPPNVMIGAPLVAQRPRVATVTMVAAAWRSISIDVDRDLDRDWTGLVFGEELVPADRPPIGADEIPLKRVAGRRLDWVFLKGRNRARAEIEIGRAMRTSTPVFAPDFKIFMPAAVDHPAMIPPDAPPGMIYEIPANVAGSGEIIALEGGYLAPMNGDELDDAGIVSEMEFANLGNAATGSIEIREDDKAAEAPADLSRLAEPQGKAAADRFRKAYECSPDDPDWEAERERRREQEGRR